MKFKKIMSVLASAVMLASTIGFAAAAAYPEPFVKGGTADGAIVVGSTAAISDYAAAIDLQTHLQSLVTTTSTSTGATASGGDSVNLATSSQRLYYNSLINSAKTTITKSEMPTLLVDGSVTDDSGTSYTYTQSITLGDSQITYGTSGNDFDDPELIVDTGYSATDPIYNYSLTFNKNVNITSTDVQGNDIELLGKKFTIGASSSLASSGSEVLYLYSSGDVIKLNEGEEVTVTIDGKEHTVAVTGITQSGTTDKVSVSIDGSTIREINEGSSTKVGGLEVYAKTVYYSAKETSQNYATLSIGSGKLKLQNGQTVYEGADETAIQNTKVNIGTAGNLLSSLTVSIAMQDTTADYIKAGESFKDPVFGGLKVNFASVTPALDATSRDKVIVDTDNSRNARVTFTSSIAGEEKTFTFLHDQDTSESTITPILADVANKTIHVVENGTIKINEYAIINSGDYGRIIKLTSVPTGVLQSTSTIQFEDALTGEKVFSGSGLTIGTGGQASTNIDGQPYYFHVENKTSDSTVQITWGSLSGYADPGSATSLFPRIKLKNGGWISILKPTTITNGTTYSIPGTETLSTYESGAVLLSAGDAGVTWYNTTNTTSYKVGNVNYTIQAASISTGILNGIDTNSDSTVDCNFNATYGGAILFLEEKKTTETSNSDNGDVICIAADASGSTTPVEMSVAEPKVTGTWSGLQTWTSDSYQQSAVTRYGTYVKYNSQDNDKIEIFYPDEQMYADVLFTSEGATITPGTSGGLGGQILVVQDSDVNSVASKNLVVVGGSCVNTVAAKLLGSNTPLCTSAFSDATGVKAGQYIIKTVASPYAAADSGKVAMLVAGYEAAETKLAVAKAKEGAASDIDTEEIYPKTSTSA